MTSMVSWLFSPRAGAPAGGLDPLDDRYYGIPMRSSRAGQVVTADSAMKASAVYRCVSILANALAMFPKGMYEKQDRGRRPAPEHPLDSIISFRPNRRQNAFVFWRQVCYHLVLRQNAYVQIVPGPSGRGWVGQLIPLNPDRVSGPEQLADGSLRYRYTPANGGQPIPMIGDIDIWHLTGLSADGLKGLSLLDVADDSIGLTLAAERHAARFFQRGVKPTGILQHDKTLKPETAREMGESFGRLYGGEEGAGKVPVLWEGMKFNAISMTLKDAEFLDSRKFSVAEIARWFGVPPHMVGDVERSTSWGTGIEQQGLHFLIYCLEAWIALIEQSIRFSLVVQPERYYPKFNTGALLRMDQKTQADVFGTYIDKGVYSPNDCRALLDMNPRPGGDRYKDPGPAAAPIPTRQAAQEPPDSEDDEDEDPEPAEARRAMARARAIAQSRAVELLDEELQALGRLAKQHAKSAGAWEESAARFYGHFAGRVATALACEKAAAKAWCETRRCLLLASGLGALQATGQRPAEEALVGLALSNGG